MPLKTVEYCQQVMFEFTDQDDTDDGNVMTQPNVKLKMRRLPPADQAATNGFAAVSSGITIM